MDARALRRALRVALACAGVAAAAADASATASTGAADERCANAFVLEQITSQYSAGKAGRFLVYEFPSGAEPPQVVFSVPAPVISSSGVYLCERGLFATAVVDVRLKPLVSRLVFDDVHRGGQAEEPSWWQRMLGLQSAGRSKHYLTDGAPNSVFALGDHLVVPDIALALLPAASAPAGWTTHAPWRHASGRPGPDTEVNILSQPGQPMISVTYLVHFDPVARKVLARVPLSQKCSLRDGGTQPVYAWCAWGIEEVNLYTGVRRQVVAHSAMRAVLTGSGILRGGGYWRAAGRTILMSRQVLSATEAVALDLFAVVDEPGQPGRLERLGPLPSSTIRSVQGTPWGLLLVSPQERRAWLYDPQARSSISAPLPLSAPSGEISAISHTRDHILLAEVASHGDGRASTRLLVLDPKLRVLHTLELPGRTNSIVSSARPWLAVNTRDDPNFTVYPDEVPGAAPR